MSVSVKALLRESKKRADGTAPIWIRITANRKSRYVSTGIYIEPKHWNSRKSEVRKSHSIAPALNDKIESTLLEAKQAALDADTAQEVKDTIQGTDGGSFTHFFQRHVDQLKASDRYWSWKSHRVTLNKLRDCFGKELDWSDLDKQALTKYERYLRHTCENGPNTIYKEMQRVRHVIRRAIKEEVIGPAEDPFLTYDKPKRRKPERRKLSMDEIRALAGVELEEGTWARWSRDAWMLAFYAGGVRFGDLCCLRVGDFKKEKGRTWLAYRMNKTGTPVQLPLPALAVEIVAFYGDGKEADDFLLPFLERGDEADPNRLRRRISSKNALANKFIKRAAEEAEIEPEGLSFHVARHSFADYARRKGGDLYAISKALGHTSLQITQAYLRGFDKDAVDKLADTMWDE